MEENCIGFIGVHIGAGYHSDAKRSEYEKNCKKACKKATEALRQKKTALEALVIAIKVLEDSPLTNAGNGSNLNLAGDVECDASIMDGQTNNFGAVGALSGIRNPILVAKKLVEEQNITYQSGRVPPMFLCGDGAHDWAVKHGVMGISRKHLITENSLKSYKKYLKSAREDDKTNNDRKRRKIDDEETLIIRCSKQDDTLLDTVGAVCMDSWGNICSGVSSGGLLLKCPGRIGQASVFGAGCWTSSITELNPIGVACSSSGCGEQLIKTLLCKECFEQCTTSSVDKDGATTLQDLLRDKFLGSSSLSCTNDKLAGIILLKCQIDTTSDSRKMIIDFSWAHTTQTMAVGYMAIGDKAAQFQVTSLERNTQSIESSVFCQGVVQVQHFPR